MTSRGLRSRNVPIPTTLIKAVLSCAGTWPYSLSWGRLTTKAGSSIGSMRLACVKCSGSVLYTRANSSLGYVRCGLPSATDRIQPMHYVVPSKECVVEVVAADVELFRIDGTPREAAARSLGSVSDR